MFWLQKIGTDSSAVCTKRQFQHGWSCILLHCTTKYNI